MQQSGEDLFGVGGDDEGNAPDHHDFAVLEEGDRFDLTYRPQCSCGGCNNQPTKSQRQAWETVWDHAVPGWRSMPVWIQSQSGADADKKREQFVKATYPSN